MKGLRLYAVALAALLLAACQSVNTQAPLDPRVTLGAGVGDYLLIQEVLSGSTSGSLLRAGVNGRYTGGLERTLKYRFIWLDSAGFEIKTLSSRWQQRRFIPGESFRLEAVAESARTRDFRILIFETTSSFATSIEE